MTTRSHQSRQRIRCREIEGRLPPRVTDLFVQRHAKEFSGKKTEGWVDVVANEVIGYVLQNAARRLTLSMKGFRHSARDGRKKSRPAASWINPATLGQACPVRDKVIDQPGRE